MSVSITHCQHVCIIFRRLRPKAYSRGWVAAHGVGTDFPVGGRSWRLLTSSGRQLVAAEWVVPLVPLLAVSVSSQGIVGGCRCRKGEACTLHWNSIV